jgi:hypothetical protein
VEGTLTNAQVGVHGGVARGSSQILPVAVGDVLSGLGVAEALGKAEVDDVDVVLLLADANQEVVWFDVSVQEMARVHELDPLKLNTSFRSQAILTIWSASMRTVLRENLRLQ